MDSYSVPINSDSFSNARGHNADSTLSLADIAVIAIGRNEGERFKACVQSLNDVVFDLIPKIYVDSGSTDGSVEYAHSHRWSTVALDMSTPFTAARARNSGVDYCRTHFPAIKAVMFVDGDCMLDRQWLTAGCELLNSKPHVVAVAGQRLERFQEQSFYNQMCQMEWSTSEGGVDYVGGDALVRLKPFIDAGGFDPTIIAGEEPDLYLRLRSVGWSVWCLSVPMTYHDANIVSINQWFKRVQRAGYAFARVRAKHSKTHSSFWKKEVRSVALWGGFVPCAFVIALFVNLYAPLIVLLLVLMQWMRIARAERQLTNPYAYAFMCLLGKPVEMTGMLKCWWALRKNAVETLIEYK